VDGVHGGLHGLRGAPAPREQSGPVGVGSPALVTDRQPGRRRDVVPIEPDGLSADPASALGDGVLGQREFRRVDAARRAACAAAHASRPTLSSAPARAAGTARPRTAAGVSAPTVTFAARATSRRILAVRSAAPASDANQDQGRDAREPLHRVRLYRVWGATSPWQATGGRGDASTPRQGYAASHGVLMTGKI